VRNGNMNLFPEKRELVRDKLNAYRIHTPRRSMERALSPGRLPASSPPRARLRRRPGR
jgi:hypothetical protein